jgi:hypothetical protein
MTGVVAVAAKWIRGTRDSTPSMPLKHFIAAAALLRTTNLSIR